MWLNSARRAFSDKRSWFHLLLLLAAVYGYVIVQLLGNEWKRPESGHGPIILIIVLWLLYRGWSDDRFGPEISGGRASRVAVLFAMSAAMFSVGIIGQISPLAYASIILFLWAGVLLFQNRGASSRLIFPLFFILFSIPLPAFIVDPVTLPMKELVAAWSELALHGLGYPVARTGVMLYIGPYELQVADACAGLRSLFTLEALGLLYINLVEYQSAIRNVGLALLAIPISLVSNIVRVILLCLITYYWGDQAGQGFLHQFAGIALFLCAAILLIGTDASLRSLAKRKISI